MGYPIIKSHLRLQSDLGKCLFRQLAYILLGVSVLASGCASLTNPVKDGIPADCVPEWYLAPPKEPYYPLPLSQLGQDKPSVYHLAPGDTLGVWIDGVTGAAGQAPPTYIPVGRSIIGPVTGLPIPVREDGTVSLPSVDPIDVSGLTIKEAEAAIRKAYTVTNTIFVPGRERILVTLLRRRQYHVIVFRDEAQNFDTPNNENSTNLLSASAKRGNAHSIDLSVGENDVLNALTSTGGPPGDDAYNEIIIEHKHRPAADSGAVTRRQGSPSGSFPQVVRIPLYVTAGTVPTFSPKDVILDEDDIVYVESRPLERFYTGGLLPPGQFTLPRDYDLDVVQAISFVQGPLVNGGFNPSGLSGQVVAPGITGPSPSLVSILRRAPDGSQINIRVDLNRALCGDPSQRVLIKAGDVLILQDTPVQAVARFFSRMIDNSAYNFVFTRMTPTHTITGGGTGLIGP